MRLEAEPKISAPLNRPDSRCAARVVVLAMADECKGCAQSCIYNPVYSVEHQTVRCNVQITLYNVTASSCQKCPDYLCRYNRRWMVGEI